MKWTMTLIMIAGAANVAGVLWCLWMIWMGYARW
jgi:hypothetical protein